jgi:hypothetical protein
VLHLIKMWLECPVEETDDRGRKTRTTKAFYAVGSAENSRLSSARHVAEDNLVAGGGRSHHSASDLGQ